MTVTITQEKPDTQDAVMLITELSDYLDPLYPKWNQFGLSSDQLIKEDVAFFTTRVDGAPAGCGGVKLCPGFGELKRMYVRPGFCGTGLGKQMLKHLEAYALHRARRCCGLRQASTSRRPWACTSVWDTGRYRLSRPMKRALPH